VARLIKLAHRVAVGNRGGLKYGFALQWRSGDPGPGRRSGSKSSTPICSGITGDDGKLTGDWRDLFNRYSDRFLLGSDT
jgi:hypothetical protein